MREGECQVLSAAVNGNKSQVHSLEIQVFVGVPPQPWKLEHYVHLMTASEPLPLLHHLEKFCVFAKHLMRYMVLRVVINRTQ